MQKPKLLLMKPKISNLLVVCLLAILVISCTEDTQQPKNLDLSINLTGKSDCKSNKSAEINQAVTNSQSCIDYSFDQAAKKLTLKHINAGFNCCPGNISCIVSYRSDTIVIQEVEEKSQCNCDCIYDLDMVVDGVEAGKYQLRVIEPYVGNQAKLNFELDLRNQKQGSWCVTRTQYPWGL
jgi:hypothetical protein